MKPVIVQWLRGGSVESHIRSKLSRQIGCEPACDLKGAYAAWHAFDSLPLDDENSRRFFLKGITRELWGTAFLYAKTRKGRQAELKPQESVRAFSQRRADTKSGHVTGNRATKRRDPGGLYQINTYSDTSQSPTTRSDDIGYL